MEEENFENTLLCSAVFLLEIPLCSFPKMTGLDDVDAYRSQFSVRIIDKEGA